MPVHVERRDAWPRLAMTRLGARQAGPSPASPSHAVRRQTVPNQTAPGLGASLAPTRRAWRCQSAPRTERPGRALPHLDMPGCLPGHASPGVTMPRL